MSVAQVPPPELGPDPPRALAPSVEDELDQQIRRLGGERRRLLALTALAAVLVWGGVETLTRFGDTLDAFLRHEIDWTGASIYVPPHPVDRTALSRIDLERVHARLVPRWALLVALADDATGRRRATYAFRELRDSVAGDPNLVDLVTELHRLVSFDVRRHAHRIDYLLWAWGDYMDRNDVPYRLEATVRRRGDRLAFFPRSYRVLSDTRNDHGSRVRVLDRMDPLGITETWLGRTGYEPDGAMLVGERLLHFAVHRVWPLLDPQMAPRRPSNERMLAAGVRADVEALLSAPHFDVLARTAEDLVVLAETADAIHARASCGARFHVWDLPYRGLSRRSVDNIVVALHASEGSSCPDLTLDEAAAIVGAAERLAGERNLPAALEALVAVVARSVAAHELRHVEDGAPETIACPGCPVGTPPDVVAELSAYLAAIASPHVGHLAALQLCTRPVPDGPSEMGPHDVAVTLAASIVFPDGCSGEAPPNLMARARTAEERYFGRRLDAEVPRRWPESIAVLTRR
jgi:hypothetical protein